jgi:hypothetical protein
MHDVADRTPAGEPAQSTQESRPAAMTSAGGSIRARQIGASDLNAVAELLASGFAARPREFWSGVLARLTAHATPKGLPKYGYLLETGGRVVGAILLIFSRANGDATTIRCNVSSWYVQPQFRSYASLFVSKALSHRGVTYLNITAAPHTLSLVRAQGYTQYSAGVFVAMPALQRHAPDVTITVARPGAGVATAEPFERELLLQHAEYGCLSLWCADEEGARPFVFRRRSVKGVIPCAQLVYCRDVVDVVRFAGPIGRLLARRGCPLVLIDANGPIPGLIGKYVAAKMPKYFKGPDRPRLGDLAYTETAMFGF